METELDRKAKIAEGMKGNKNASKNKLFAEQLKRHLIQNPHKLEKIVEKLIEDAMEGNIASTREVIDRVDGKAIQSTDITSDGTPLSNILVSFVKPNE
jgi:ribosomal protein L17